MGRIDAHHHLWDLRRRPQPWADGLSTLARSFAFADLAPHLAQHDVTATIVVTSLPDFDETTDLLAVAAGEPAIRGVVGWLDLTAPDLAHQIAALVDGRGGDRLVGLRHPIQAELETWCDRPAVRRGLATLAASDLTYDLLVTADQLKAATTLVADLPDLCFVLDHCGNPPLRDGDLAEWTAAVSELARFPNVAVKMSGLVTQADHETWSVADVRPAADHVLSAFGPSRTMFGSDWPVCLLATNYSGVVALTEQLLAGWSAGELGEVFGGTATRWYRLASRDLA